MCSFRTFLKEKHTIIWAPRLPSSVKVNYFVVSQIHLLMSINVLATDFWSKNLPYIVPEYILIFSQFFFENDKTQRFTQKKKISVN